MKRWRETAWMLLAGLLATAAQAGVVSGRVYLDGNGNGRPDAGEPGVPAVTVSDGTLVVATDAAGRYRLESAEANPLVQICLPRDHRAPRGFWQPSGGRSELDFALESCPQADDFYFIQMTDTHIGSVPPFEQFLARVNAFPRPLAFVVNTGDVVGGVDTVEPDQAVAQFDRYRDATAKLRVPLFDLPGNHEHVAINVPTADKTHPRYGKGLYRELFGPTYYAWDWGRVHFVALDGTSLPYQERLGERQRAWLKADLQHQPADKPLVLLCHQPLPELRDAPELVALLEGRNVWAGFCGHWHRTLDMPWGPWPVHLTGALSGSWWSGPNPDGSPQGFRLVHVTAQGLKSVYSNREGECSLYVSSPSAMNLLSGCVEFDVAVLDFGRPVQVQARFAGRDVPVTQVTHEADWSTWKGRFDSAAVFDDAQVLEVTALADGKTVGSCPLRCLVVNGRPAPGHAAHGAELKFQVRGVHAADEVLVNDEPLGTIAADTPNSATVSFPIAAERLQKLTKVTVRAAPHGKGRDSFSVGPIWLDYGKAKLVDLRFPAFERHALGDPSPRAQPQRDWYFALPTLD